MARSKTINLKYDFSVLSKRRLATYDRLMTELESQEQAEATDLGDDVLELLSAAGDLTAGPQEGDTITWPDVDLP